MNRPLKSFAIVIGCIAVVGFVHGQTGQPKSLVDPASVAIHTDTVLPPDDLVGHDVHIYFRENLHYPAKPDADVPAGVHLTCLSGRVQSVKSGWIELCGERNSPGFWIAAGTVGYIADDKYLASWTPEP